MEVGGGGCREMLRRIAEWYGPKAVIPALRFAHEAGLLDESLWKEMDSHQSRNNLHQPSPPAPTFPHGLDSPRHPWRLPSSDVLTIARAA